MFHMAMAGAGDYLIARKLKKKQEETKVPQFFKWNIP
jgi:hypothetical protein